ncbi:hydrogen peroxide-dependent heme synthase [Microbacterium candidum]|uniref:Coproheme decarboxylase n=1 Tax=Microbacterium candidum TaxID=3041922 RepID=A0ABT7N1S8_9MICO|nr:hydrogen peroxide-dependent heme synthase [Microbacterium sp. ASV49]MDL9980661.1 chlorite dismutase family protein [Microbacterium sp. ASV49]
MSDPNTPATDFFTLYAVLRRDPNAPGGGGSGEAFAEVAASVAPRLRGLYDVSGMRADADVLLWLTGDSAQQLQADLRALRRSRELAPLLPTWNAMGVHRQAEFSREHAPAFARGLAPKGWVTVYPFVRSYDWYVLPAEDRGRMLADHGGKGREFPQVLSNTVASFALGDYEWLLALEADDVVDLVDLMRHLRATDARLHVREETPFFTGRRIDAADLAEVLA